jgi:hypothetical protein
LDIYDDRLLKLAQKHASITWGNNSFTVQSPKVIFELTQTDGHLTTALNSRTLAFEDYG